MIKESRNIAAAIAALTLSVAAFAHSKENVAAGASTGSVTRGRMGWKVTSTSSVTDGESSVTGQKKQARRPDGWSLSLSE